MRSFFCPFGKSATLIAGLILLTLPSAKAQDTAQKKSDERIVPAPQSMGDTKKPGKKISPTDATPVSAEEAAQSATKEGAQSPSEKKDDQSTTATSDSVLEFHPAPQDEKSTTKSDARPRAKHPRKNIHGEAYGEITPTDAGTHGGGGAAGATSKSGKTSVYVQGEQTRSSQSPH